MNSKGKKYVRRYWAAAAASAVGAVGATAGEDRAAVSNLSFADIDAARRLGTWLAYRMNVDWSGPQDALAIPPALAAHYAAFGNPTLAEVWESAAELAAREGLEPLWDIGALAKLAKSGGDPPRPLHWWATKQVVGIYMRDRQAWIDHVWHAPAVAADVAAMLFDAFVVNRNARRAVDGNLCGVVNCDAAPLLTTSVDGLRIGVVHLPEQGPPGPHMCQSYTVCNPILKQYSRFVKKVCRIDASHYLNNDKWPTFVGRDADDLLEGFSDWNANILGEDARLDSIESFKRICSEILHPLIEAETSARMRLQSLNDWLSVFLALCPSEAHLAEYMHRYPDSEKALRMCLDGLPGSYSLDLDNVSMKVIRHPSSEGIQGESTPLGVDILDSHVHGHAQYVSDVMHKLQSLARVIERFDYRNQVVCEATAKGYEVFRRALTNKYFSNAASIARQASHLTMCADIVDDRRRVQEWLHEWWQAGIADVAESLPIVAATMPYACGFVEELASEDKLEDLLSHFGWKTRPLNIDFHSKRAISFDRVLYHNGASGDILAAVERVRQGVPMPTLRDASSSLEVMAAPCALLLSGASPDRAPSTRSKLGTTTNIMLSAAGVDTRGLIDRTGLMDKVSRFVGRLLCPQVAFGGNIQKLHTVYMAIDAGYTTGSVAGVGVLNLASRAQRAWKSANLSAARMALAGAYIESVAYLENVPDLTAAVLRGRPEGAIAAAIVANAMQDLTVSISSLGRSIHSES